MLEFLPHYVGLFIGIGIATGLLLRLVPPRCLSWFIDFPIDWFEACLMVLMWPLIWVVFALRLLAVIWNWMRDQYDRIKEQILKRWYKFRGK